jgi:hypothetical protein
MNAVKKEKAQTKVKLPMNEQQPQKEKPTADVSDSSAGTAESGACPIGPKRETPGFGMTWLGHRVWAMNTSSPPEFLNPSPDNDPEILMQFFWDGTAWVWELKRTGKHIVDLLHLCQKWKPTGAKDQISMRTPQILFPLFPVY